jgi:hypothetical protein
MRTNVWFHIASFLTAFALLTIPFVSTLAQDEVALLPANANTFVPAAAPLGDLLSLVSEGNMRQHITNLQNMGTRHVNSSLNTAGEGIGGAAMYITQQFESGCADTSPVQVSAQPFYAEFNGRMSEQQNIIATLPGSDASAGTIIVGAHYDSISTDFNDAYAFAPGANDNASGVAGLLELSRILCGQTHRATLMFVAFAAEEVNKQGSRAFVRDVVTAGNMQVKAMINLDIIGGSMGANGDMNPNQIRLFSDAPEGMSDSSSRQLARLISQICHNNNVPLEVVMQDRGDRPGRYGDHLSFSERGYPAVRFIEAVEHPNNQHSAMDTLNYLQPGYMGSAAQVVLATVFVLANGTFSPQMTVGSDAMLTWQPDPDAVSYVVSARMPGGLTYDQQFEVTTPQIALDTLIATGYTSVSIASRDASGVVGQPSMDWAFSGV